MKVTERAEWGGKKGLLAAMVCHAVADIVFKVIVPLSQAAMFALFSRVS